MKEVLFNHVVNAVEACRGGTLILTVSGPQGSRILTDGRGHGGGGAPGPPAGDLRALCDRIVEAHGSRIDVESRPGPGSRIAVTLPGNPFLS